MIGSGVSNSGLFERFAPEKPYYCPRPPPLPQKKFLQVFARFCIEISCGRREMSVAYELATTPRRHDEYIPGAQIASFLMIALIASIDIEVFVLRCLC